VYEYEYVCYECEVHKIIQHDGQLLMQAFMHRTRLNNNTVRCGSFFVNVIVIVVAYISGTETTVATTRMMCIYHQS